MASKKFDEKTLRAAIEFAREEYSEAVKTQPAAMANELGQKVKSLIARLAEGLAAGADACPDCGEKPIGMKRRTGCYEVGCLPCTNRAQGEAAEEAVENWNAGAAGDRNRWTPPLGV